MSYRLWVNAVSLTIFLANPWFAQKSASWHDPSPHTVQFVTVEDSVKLEVLDWGGSGRPLVLLAGEGGSAQVFDDFAPNLSSNYQVYGFTRRGSLEIVDNSGGRSKKC
jgi:non-heme chloroperoxidase